MWYTGLVPEYKRKPNTKCSVCKKPIYRRPFEIERSKGKISCSIKCYGISCRKETPCIVCKKPMLSGLNKKTCSRSCANKHRVGIGYNLGRPKDKVTSQKRIKMRILDKRGGSCERCGYNKKHILEMHHIDRNRGNNKSINLEILCPNCHSEEHYLNKS